MSRAIPISARKTKTERQPNAFCNCPPITGAIAGAMANIIVMCDISRCAAGPLNKSRTMARLTTTPAQAAKPCRPRNSHRCSIRVANRQPIEASANSHSEMTITRRRPMASEMAPCHSDISENMSKYAVSVCCTSSGEACRESPMSWSEGR